MGGKQWLEEEQNYAKMKITSQTLVKCNLVYCQLFLFSQMTEKSANNSQISLLSKMNELIYICICLYVSQLSLLK